MTIFDLFILGGAVALLEPINVRACPACGGDPNEAAPVTR